MEEYFENKEVTYTLVKDGKLFIIEHVPARVNLETGEQIFSPRTVERLHKIVWEGREPVRFVQAPVFEFA